MQAGWQREVFLSSSRTGPSYPAEDGLVGRALLHHRSDLVEILRHCQLSLPVRVQQPEICIQLAAVVASQLGADGIEGDVEGSAVGLQYQYTPHGVGEWGGHQSKLNK